jgi:hypothetical protein
MLVFNRPEQTRRVFAAIQEARPSRLYVAADGPRGLPGDEERCTEVRSLVQHVQWPCQIETLFRDQNLGCGVAVRSALDWFFEHEPEGIILEDDCLPSQSFFRYCTELLARYRHDTRVMSICGSDFLSGKHQTDASYYFSMYHDPWGWATWRRAWKLCDHNLKNWQQFFASGGLKSLSDGQPEFERYWRNIFNDMQAGAIDTWDYPFIFSQFANRGLTCRPLVNMITNIGHHSSATHTKYELDPLSNLPKFELQFPLRHPVVMVRDFGADQLLSRTRFGIFPEVTRMGRVRKRMVTAVRRLSRVLPSQKEAPAQ